MPRRTDIQSVLIIGSGPIVIGQACEFDYSGTQAIKALKEDGYRVILVNSNPATIMTDPQFSDRTYVESLDVPTVSKILRAERPDAILPTLGGQTGLNLTTQLVETGIVEELGIRLLGADYNTIKKAEDREDFKTAVRQCGLDLPRSGIARSIEEARAVAKHVGVPCVIRPAYTLGGTGGSLVEEEEEYLAKCEAGLAASPVTEILIEEYLRHWKEFELEVMRDRADNCVVVCSIENVDPMGVHTGDSVTVAPAQTLTDREYQRMRNAAFAVIRAIGVETGGSNIQFAVHPGTGRMVVIEMNPRVSRSSALASKATGFPIAKIATKLAVGYTLDEIPNDITKKTPACFEPTIDYCVVKAPKFTFQKFPDADETLTTHMKSVGEVMAIGRTFKEALQKAIVSLEIKADGLGCDTSDRLRAGNPPSRQEIIDNLKRPVTDRLFFVRYGLKDGMTVGEIARFSGIDPWFVDQILELVEFEKTIEAYTRFEDVPQEVLYEAKQLGYSDAQLARFWRCDGADEPSPALFRARRRDRNVEATFKLVDTCAAEFEAATPYYYSTYESEDESRWTSRRKVVILGGGPNRIGQGIEFDYCCVHAAFALREEGVETIMVNSNPETVSTDYDTSDKLYFEPLSLENVCNICDREKPEGLILQLGGQTPLNLAAGLAAAGQRILGTSHESIELAEEREQFTQLLRRLGLRQPANGTATTVAGAVRVAEEIGFPVLIRPSFVLGGEAMRVVWNRQELESYMGRAIIASDDRPVLVDKFLEEAVEIDVDAISDGTVTVIGGIMEHIEEAGVHSGDSSCCLPPHSLRRTTIEEIKEITYKLTEALEVQGLINLQLAVHNGRVYILEVNPRASRTIPYVSKAIGVPLAKLAAKVMIGGTLADLGFTREVQVRHMAVKMPVFPFNRFPRVDPVLGPEMKSTGEVMGIDDSFGTAYAKAHMAVARRLPTEGAVFVSVCDPDKKYLPHVIRPLQELGFQIAATGGTRLSLQAAGISGVLHVKKLNEGSPNVWDLMREKKVQMIINTPKGRGPRLDDRYIRARAIDLEIPCLTTMAAVRAAIDGIRALRRRDWGVLPLQEYFPPKN